MSRITISLPAALVRSLEAEARLRGMKVSELIRVRLEAAEHEYSGLGFIALGASTNGTACRSAEDLLEESWFGAIAEK